MQFKNIIFAAGIVGFAVAEGTASNGGAQAGVPKDLSGGFKVQDVQIEVILKGHRNHKNKGHKDGTSTLTTSVGPIPTEDGGKKSGHHGHHGHHREIIIEDLATKPHFHLRKHNGATVDQTKWVIVMVDSTSEDHRVLHYVHSDYTLSANGSLASTTTPQMAWQAPARSDDQSTQHQYTFLMYSQQGDFHPTMMPAMNQAVNMSQWVQSNGLQKAVAGQAVDVNAAANATGSNSTGPSASGSAPTNAPSPSQAKSGAVSFRAQAASAGVIGAVVAFGMAML